MVNVSPRTAEYQYQINLDRFSDAQLDCLECSVEEPFVVPFKAV